MNALLPTAFLWGPGLAVFVVECVVFRLTRHRGWPFRLLPVAVLAVPAFRWWEAWRWGGPFQPLTLLAWELLTLSMAAGLLLGVLAGALWAKKE